jgi:hypothetical protein
MGCARTMWPYWSSISTAPRSGDCWRAAAACAAARGVCWACKEHPTYVSAGPATGTPHMCLLGLQRAPHICVCWTCNRHPTYVSAGPATGTPHTCLLSLQRATYTCFALLPLLCTAPGLHPCPPPPRSQQQSRWAQGTSWPERTWNRVCTCHRPRGSLVGHCRLTCPASAVQFARQHGGVPAAHVLYVCRQQHTRQCDRQPAPCISGCSGEGQQVQVASWSDCVPATSAGRAAPG